MSLFSGTKKYVYRVGLNNPPMEYVDFVEVFRKYADSEEFKNLLNDNAFSIEKADTKYTPFVAGSDPADFPYELNLVLVPAGLIRFEIETRGEKQGLAMAFFSLTIIAELKNSDKAWAIGFCKAIHEKYETAFASFNTEKGDLFDFSKYNY